ncbi:hypothetical protein THASP1DRAFT_33688 [Thamnocephalis sphaerospora]|uniref:AMP-dependent synthetase/ligase domain-containing protein n=1 Tax=Thamnocephalis sphaerospora TaxID=78915 RepID=A0A4P9XG05_9FUNG|nr:hypothetical protein THASP1DRAFT_33688 [Thamnocephalis sphaerospora]|eukprot:RKP04536.1 hypothetical protein THASP1DRAFT_33688 [Thamnocephalis sphaerospora]
MRVYRSRLPDVDIPEEDIFHFLFERPDRRCNEHVEVLIDAHSTRRMTGGQLREASLRFAGGLQQRLGAQNGQVLAIFAHNSINYSTVLFGSLAAGLTVTVANPAYHVHELVYQLRGSGAQFIVASFDVLSVARKAAVEAGILATRIVVLDAHRQSNLEPMSVDEHITHIYVILPALPVDQKALS